MQTEVDKFTFIFTEKALTRDFSVLNCIENKQTNKIPKQL